MISKNSKIKIAEPIIEQDFQEALKLIEDNVFRDDEFDVDYLQSALIGEIFVAKNESEVVGVIVQRMPGRILNEQSEDYLSLEKISANKDKIGHIALIAIAPGFQGKGVGKKLVKKALEYQKCNDAKAVIVHCWQSSPGNGSQKLFEYFGFKPLIMHKAPWHDHALEVGSEKCWCPVCGNPCTCDELEMVKYL